MRQKLAKPEQLIARIAARQHGVIRLDQLLWAGLSSKAITRRVKAGHLHRLYRGVYAVGHSDLKPEGRWLATVFACGKGAVLSHESAAALWKLSPTSPSTVQVTVPSSNGRRKRPGIRLHYSTTLTSKDVTRRRNIPVLRICREHGIPKPEVNVRLGPYEVDFLWRSERLVVEVDSWRYHSDRHAFEADRARDRELARRGFVVLRFTDRELSTEPERVATSLRAQLRVAR